MAGKAKFNKESAFKSIIGAGRTAEPEAAEPTAKGKTEKIDRVQWAYFLVRDIDKVLRKKALEDERNLTETVNEVLRYGLTEYL